MSTHQSYHFLVSQVDHLLQIHKKALNNLPVTCSKGFIIEFRYEQKLGGELLHYQTAKLVQSFTELVYIKPYILCSKTAMQEILCPRLSLMGVPEEDHNKLVLETLSFLGRAYGSNRKPLGLGLGFVPVVVQISSLTAVNDESEEELAIEMAMEQSVEIQSFKCTVSKSYDVLIKELKKVKTVYDQLEICAICLRRLEDRMKVGADYISWLPCNHAFHEGCIGKWLSNNSSCPTCRFQFTVMTELSKT